MHQNIYEQYDATVQLQESRRKKAQYLATLSSDESDEDTANRPPPLSSLLHSSSPSPHNSESDITGQLQALNKCVPSEEDQNSTTMSYSDQGEGTPPAVSTPVLDPQTLALIAELQRQNLANLAALHGQSNAMLEHLDERSRRERQHLEELTKKEKQEQEEKNHYERLAREEQHSKDRKDEREAARERELRRSIPNPKHMEEGADIVEYVELFESNMEARDIPKRMWAQSLIPLLSPTPRMAAQSLPAGDRSDYDKVREAALATCQETYKRAGATFFSLTKAQGESFQAYGTKLHRLCTRFSSADTIAKVQERVTIERFIHFLPAAAAGFVRDRAPKTLTDTCRLADDYFSNHGMSISSYTGEYRLGGQKPHRQEDYQKPWRQGNSGWQQQHKKPWRDQHDNSEKAGGDQPVPGRVDSMVEGRPPPKQPQPSQPNKQQQQSNRYSPRCYKCNQTGHIASNCPQKVNLISDYHRDEPLSSTCVVQGRVAGKKIKNILVDSGAEISVASEEIVPSSAETKGQTMVAGVTGTPVNCRLVDLPISINERDFQLQVAVLPQGSLSYPLLLGRDTPGLRIHWSIGPESPNDGKMTTPQEVAVLTRSQARKEEARRLDDQSATDSSGAIITDLAAQENTTGEQTQSLPPAPTHTLSPCSDPAHSSSNPNFPFTPQQVTDVSDMGVGDFGEGYDVEGGNEDGALRGEDDGTDDQPTTTSILDPDLCRMEPQSTEPLTQLMKDSLLTQEEFLQKQEEDPSLATLWNQARQDGQGGWYEIHQGLLTRKVKDEWDQEAHLLVIPECLRKTVWGVAHRGPLAGHQGAHKTRQKIATYFYWPQLSKDVARWTKSCHECQTVNKTRDRRAPQQQMPIIENPWTRIAIDIVGPLPRTKRGNRFILTVMDFSSRYPEAFPMRKVDAPSVCDNLIQLFSRFGLPQQLLSDNGSNFVSRVTEGLLGRLGVHHIKCSPYRPQTNGMIERWHSVLKRMLGKLENTEAEWDKLLPLVLFAYRDTPHSATGYTPFQIVFGRNVRGPTSVLKATWSGEQPTSATAARYLFDVKQRMEVARELAGEKERLAKEKSKLYQDRKSADDPLMIGDEVLCRLPGGARGLADRWEGPFQILEIRSPVTYLVSAPLRGQSGRIFHRNCIKRYAREVNTTSVMVADGGLDDSGQLELVPNPTPPLNPASDRWASPDLLADLPPPRRTQLISLLQEFDSTFSDIPGRTDVVSCPLDVTESKPISLSPYRVPVRWQPALQEEIDNLLELGVIRPSESPWASPVVCVRKKDGQIRMCTDFRRLNSVTKDDAYPFPHTEELIEKAAAARWCTTLDLSKGYYQVPIAPTDIEKTAFITTAGKFEYTVMPFGLKNAPSVFQRLMDKVLKGCPFASAYIDDVVITSPTWEEHLSHIRQTLQAFRAAGLTVKLVKCCFAAALIHLLGHLVGRGEIRPQQLKTLAVREYKQPKTKKDIRVFLGMAGYYRRFMPNFASVTAPISKLLKKEHPERVVWKEEQHAAFEQVKEWMTSDPVLKAPDYSLPFTLQTDASFSGLGAVLSQTGKDNEEHPVAFWSRKTLDRETRYSASEVECLAAVEAVKHFAHYLLGAHFTLVTDHRALTSLQIMKNDNPRLTRWSLALQPFSYSVVHRSGHAHSNADGLSRQAWEEATPPG